MTRGCRTGAEAVKSHGTQYYRDVALIDTQASEIDDRRYGS